VAVSAEFSEYIEELFADFGPVRIRRMFGGAGIFHGDVMIGLVSDGTVYLRADADTAPDFEAEGSTPFGYDGRSKRINLPYWKLPERLLDEPDELAHWVRKAHDVALSAKSKKTKRKRD